ncbi:MAG: propanediol dehydratase [Acidobacteria bacterium]|nr:propanediol dehydratase [Acidobacteriota bacterium]
MFTSKRFQARAQRDINKDSFIHEWPEKGLILFESPNDPLPQIKVRQGRVVELDGKPEAEFDLLDRFIAEYAIDASIAEECMATDSPALARSLADFNVSRQEVVRLFSGLTPAKLTQVVNHLNVVEMMMALQKMRARRTPSNQAHVTNRKEHPALLAADAAEAVEEELSLQLALLGLTTYAETLSVYGTEQAFRDGDDTPWSKAFLASAYASRGIKVRFTSGTGSEALMGHSEGKSMLYLEARCLMAIKGAGSQGVQNGSISCIALPESLPGGVRGVMAENLIATLLDLELASGNDAMASHSQIRKSAKLMLQMLPGTDFIFSGYSSMPREDNLFGGGNFDAEDLDDYNVLQRDMQVDGGLWPVNEVEALAVRRRAAQVIQTVFRVLDLPAITDAEVEASVVARSSGDMPNRNVVADLAAAERFLKDGKSGLEVIRALAKHGFRDIPEKVLGLQKLRVSGDYLQTAAIVLPGPRVLSAINDPNDYGGPGTDYSLSARRWQEIASIPQALQPQSIGQPSPGQSEMRMEERGDAQTGANTQEIVIALGPAFGTAMDATLLGLPHHAVLRALMDGIQAEGLTARVVKIYATSDCGFVGHADAQLSGSEISVGIQSKGTTVIHRRDLEPLKNLELFPQVPNLTLDCYRVIGQNAAKYAKGEPVLPVPIQIDNLARLKYIVNTTLLHHRETEQVVKGKPAQEVEVTFLMKQAL